MKCRIWPPFPSQRIFNPQRKAYSLSYTYLIESQKDRGQSYVCSDAHQLFDETSELDVVSATTAISHFARRNRHKDSVHLFSRMLILNIRPNEFTFGTVIHSSTALKDLNSGRQLHACATKIGLHSNVFVGSATLDLYSKLSTIEEARRAFEDTHEPNVVSYTSLICGYFKKERFDDALGLFLEMPERNVVSWNAMIGGYSQTGHNEEAVNFFIQMLRQGLVPNPSTFPCAISAASNIVALGMGKSFHACAIKFLGNIGLFVGNSLVSFYAKCGSMEESLLVFRKLPERNVVSWNALICGYAQNGRGEEALDFYQKMQSTGLQSNSVTVLGILLACNHVGLVDEGYTYFNQTRVKNPSMLKPEHYGCIVDLLSRAGRLQEAERFICDLPFDPGIGFWKALLGGCLIHSNMELGQVAAKKILALDPGDVSSYVMLSNAHSAAERWESVSIIRQEMREKGMKRVQGCSWIEIKNQVHVFGNADRRHSKKDEIYMVLKVFLEHIADSQPSKLLEESYVQLYEQNGIQRSTSRGSCSM